MSLQTERTRTIIMCIDREFKARVTSMLIDCAIAAEKFHYEKLLEARDKFLEDEKIGILVLKACDYTLKEFFNILKTFEELYKTRASHIIVYFGQELQNVVETNKVNYEHCSFLELQPNKRELNNILNPIKVSTIAHKKSANEAFVDASRHLKDTITDLQTVADDMRNLEGVQRIGQRFNGIYGTYLFFQSHKGYSELMQLASIINDITRHYSPPNNTATLIAEKHFNIVLDAAKCSFLMLKDLRENHPLAEAITLNIENLLKRYEECPEIKRLGRLSQQEIDQILNAM